MRTQHHVLGLALVLGLSACATSSDPGSKAAADDSCMRCGEVVQIVPARQGAASGAPLAQQDSARIQLPQAPGSRLHGLGGPQGLPPGHNVPVYTVREVSTRRNAQEVVLRMDSGQMERILVEEPVQLRIGERVKIVGNRLMPAPSSPSSTAPKTQESASES